MQAKADKKLVARVLAKERAAFDEFFTTYFARLTRFCDARVGDEQAVEDIVQETLVKALRSLHTYRGEALLFTWLCGICRNQIADWYRKNGRQQEQEVHLDDDPVVLAALESLGIAEQDALTDKLALNNLITLTLDHLPERYGQALELKYLEGRSVKEIALQMNLGRLATQSLLSRARVAFRQGFSDLARDIGREKSHEKG